MLEQDNRGPGRLRELLAGSEPVVAPGAYDALSARLVAQAGFEAVYMTGFGASASLLGRPDVLFVEAPESEAEVAAVAEAFPETPLLFNAVEGGRTPPVALARLRELGFRLVLSPLTALLAATAAVQQALSQLRSSGTPRDDGALSFAGFTEVVGLPEIQRLEARFAAAPGP